MSELKTLNDIGTLHLCDRASSEVKRIKWINGKELKAEVVKWVKDDKRRIKQGNINVNILLRRWMVRLNLTEVDLIEREGGQNNNVGRIQEKTTRKN